MANTENLSPIRSTEEARERGRKGGIASGKSRREKRTVQKILSDLLDSEIKEIPQFELIANQLGIERERSVKDIFTLVCLLNSVKSGNLGDLELLAKMLGEETEREANNGILEDLAKYLNGKDVK